jgi:ATP-dependent helicase/DNAse subunit B
MAKDPFKATWVSHSSMGDFIKCPRAYYLHNVYKDPKTRRKINLVSPALSLGLAVHDVLEGLDKYKTEDRFKRDLLADLDVAWQRVTGKKGGFKTVEEEKEIKDRAKKMIERVIRNPDPMQRKIVRLKEAENGLPPNYYLSEDENIILCGKIDWLIWKPEDDSLHILDFKTGKNEENEDSLQLPIYQLLLKNLQKRKVTGASYWYLDKDDKPIEVDLPDEEDSFRRVYELAQKVKYARENSEFDCPKGEGGCFACRPFEKILRGEAEYIGVGDMKQDLYLL